MEPNGMIGPTVKHDSEREAAADGGSAVWLPRLHCQPDA